MDSASFSFSPSLSSWAVVLSKMRPGPIPCCPLAWPWCWRVCPWANQERGAAHKNAWWVGGLAARLVDWQVDCSTGTEVSAKRMQAAAASVADVPGLGHLGSTGLSGTSTGEEHLPSPSAAAWPSQPSKCKLRWAIPWAITAPPQSPTGSPMHH